MWGSQTTCVFHSIEASFCVFFELYGIAQYDAQYNTTPFLKFRSDGCPLYAASVVWKWCKMRFHNCSSRGLNDDFLKMIPVILFRVKGSQKWCHIPAFYFPQQEGVVPGVFQI